TLNLTNAVTYAPIWEANMYALLLLTSSLLAGVVGYHQIPWSPPQTVFGAPHSQSTVPLHHWETTFRLGEMAWSLSEAKLEHTAGADLTYGPPPSSNVVAERWPLLSP